LKIYIKIIFKIQNLNKYNLHRIYKHALKLQPDQIPEEWWGAAMRTGARSR
jgi:hypothetical protein